MDVSLNQITGLTRRNWFRFIRIESDQQTMATLCKEKPITMAGRHWGGEQHFRPLGRKGDGGGVNARDRLVPKLTG